MTKATLTITDKGAAIEVNCELDGPFDAKDNAHQHANILLNYLDELAAGSVAAETKPVENEGLRQHLEAIKDELVAALPYRGRDTKLWAAVDHLTTEIEKALAIPDEAPAPMDMAQKIVGANGLALSSGATSLDQMPPQDTRSRY